MPGVDIADQNQTACVPIIKAKRPTRNLFVRLLLMVAANVRFLCAVCRGLKPSTVPMKHFLRELSIQMIDQYRDSTEFVPPPKHPRPTPLVVILYQSCIQPSFIL
jgi:hypothetical protein